MVEQRLFTFEISKKALLKIYDRFSFDNLFRILLVNGFQHEEALNFILCNCELSSLVFQERIYNGYYLNIDIEDAISPDLLELEKQCLIKIMGENVKDEIGSVLQWECTPKTVEDREDCIQYIYNLVINRSYDGYLTEIKTIYGKLQRELSIEIKPAPDEWDRLYNVDFYIQVGEKYIGLQIKPVTYEQTPEIYRWKEWLSKTHKKFEENYGGKGK